MAQFSENSGTWGVQRKNGRENHSLKEDVLRKWVIFPAIFAQHCLYGNYPEADFETTLYVCMIAKIWQKLPKEDRIRQCLFTSRFGSSFCRWFFPGFPISLQTKGYQSCTVAQKKPTDLITFTIQFRLLKKE